MLYQEIVMLSLLAVGLYNSTANPSKSFSHRFCNNLNREHSNMSDSAIFIYYQNELDGIGNYGKWGLVWAYCLNARVGVSNNKYLYVFLF